MKKIGFMIVYNDSDYVDYAIRSVKDWLDKLVIVEGAFEITMATGRPARSTDGTLDIINSHVDNKKVFLKQVNLHEHKDHYDLGYQFAVNEGADWAVMIDSDEIWTDSAKMMTDALLNPLSKGGFFELRIQQYCFINDFNTWYPGTYPRIFRCIEGAKFVYDNEVQFPGMSRNLHKIYTFNQFKIFHYGYVRRMNRWQMKQDYMWEKDNNPILKTEYGLKENTYIIPKDISIYNFVGEHPEIMKIHPFFNKTAREIIYG